MGVTFSDEEDITHKKFTEIFEECFPFYLAIGMSSAEYWEGDPSLTRYFRKAYKIKQDENNRNAWLQGVYIYDAVSTALHNAFRSKNTKPIDYATQPYNLENKEKTEFEKAKEFEDELQKSAAWLENFTRINQKKREPRAVEPEPNI